MKARLYWTIRHLWEGLHELRFAASCWRLARRVGFMEWRWRLEALLPHGQLLPVSGRPERPVRYVAQQM